MELALRRGEIDMVGGGRTLMPLVTEESAVGVCLVQLGSYRKGKFSRRPDLPDVPTMADLFGDKRPTGVAWEAFMAAISPTFIYKLIAAPRGTPDEIMNVLIEAYGKMGQDPNCTKPWKRMVAPLCLVGSGEETTSLLSQVLDVPPEALEYTNNLKRKFGIIK
jgi:hypothetical protein